MTSWKDAGIGRGRHGSRRIIFGKVAVVVYSKSYDTTPDVDFCPFSVSICKCSDLYKQWVLHS